MEQASSHRCTQEFFDAESHTAMKDNIVVNIDGMTVEVPVRTAVETIEGRIFPEKVAELLPYNEIAQVDGRITEVKETKVTKENEKAEEQPSKPVVTRKIYRGKMQDFHQAAMVRSNVGVEALDIDADCNDAKQVEMTHVKRRSNTYMQTETGEKQTLLDSAVLAKYGGKKNLKVVNIQVSPMEEETEVQEIIHQSKRAKMTTVTKLRKIIVTKTVDDDGEKKVIEDDILDDQNSRENITDLLPGSDEAVRIVRKRKSFRIKTQDSDAMDWVTGNNVFTDQHVFILSQDGLLRGERNTVVMDNRLKEIPFTRDSLSKEKLNTTNTENRLIESPFKLQIERKRKVILSPGSESTIKKIVTAKTSAIKREGQSDTDQGFKIEAKSKTCELTADQLGIINSQTEYQAIKKSKVLRMNAQEGQKIETNLGKNANAEGVNSEVINKRNSIGNDKKPARIGRINVKSKKELIDASQINNKLKTIGRPYKPKENALDQRDIFRCNLSVHTSQSESDTKISGTSRPNQQKLFTGIKQNKSDLSYGTSESETANNTEKSERVEADRILKTKGIGKIHEKESGRTCVELDRISVKGKGEGTRVNESNKTKRRIIRPSTPETLNSNETADNSSREPKILMKPDTKENKVTNQQDINAGSDRTTSNSICNTFKFGAATKTNKDGEVPKDMILSTKDRRNQVHLNVATDIGSVEFRSKNVKDKRKAIEGDEGNKKRINEIKPSIREEKISYFEQASLKSIGADKTQTKADTKATKASNTNQENVNDGSLKIKCSPAYSTSNSRPTTGIDKLERVSDTVLRAEDKNEAYSDVFSDSKSVELGIRSKERVKEITEISEAHRKQRKVIRPFAAKEKMLDSKKVSHYKVKADKTKENHDAKVNEASKTDHAGTEKIETSGPYSMSRFAIAIDKDKQEYISTDKNKSKNEVESQANDNKSIEPGSSSVNNRENTIEVVHARKKCGNVVRRSTPDRGRILDPDKSDKAGSKNEPKSKDKFGTVIRKIEKFDKKKPVEDTEKMRTSASYRSSKSGSAERADEQEIIVRDKISMTRKDKHTELNSKPVTKEITQITGIDKEKDKRDTLQHDRNVENIYRGPERKSIDVYIDETGKCQQRNFECNRNGGRHVKGCFSEKQQACSAECTLEKKDAGEQIDRAKNIIKEDKHLSDNLSRQICKNSERKNNLSIDSYGSKHDTNFPAEEFEVIPLEIDNILSDFSVTDEETLGGFHEGTSLSTYDFGEIEISVGSYTCDKALEGPHITKENKKLLEEILQESDSANCGETDRTQLYLKDPLLCDANETFNFDHTISNNLFTNNWKSHSQHDEISETIVPINADFEGSEPDSIFFESTNNGTNNFVPQIIDKVASEEETVMKTKLMEKDKVMPQSITIRDEEIWDKIHGQDEEIFENLNHKDTKILKNKAVSMNNSGIKSEEGQELTRQETNQNAEDNSTDGHMAFESPQAIGKELFEYIEYERGDLLENNGKSFEILNEEGRQISQNIEGMSEKPLHKLDGISTAILVKGHNVFQNDEFISNKEVQNIDHNEGYISLRGGVLNEVNSKSIAGGDEESFLKIDNEVTETAGIIMFPVGRAQEKTKLKNDKNFKITNHDEYLEQNRPNLETNGGERTQSVGLTNDEPFIAIEYTNGNRTENFDFQEYVMQPTEVQNDQILEKVDVKREETCENTQEENEQFMKPDEMQEGQILENVDVKDEGVFENIVRPKEKVLKPGSLQQAQILDYVELESEGTFETIEQLTERIMNSNEFQEGQILKSFEIKQEENFENIEEQKGQVMQSVELQDVRILENVEIKEKKVFKNIEKPKEKVVEPEKLEDGQILENAAVADEETFENTENQSGKIEEPEELEDQIILVKVEVEDHGTFVNIEQQKEQVMELDELQDGYISEKVATKDVVLLENLEEYKEQSIPSFELQDGQVLEDIQVRGEKAFESIEQQKEIVIETDEVTDAKIFENVEIKDEETFKNIGKRKERYTEPDKLQEGQVLENVITRSKETYRKIEKQKENVIQSVELFDGEILENVQVKSEETFTNLEQQKEKIIKPEDLQVGQILENAVVAEEETFENTENQSGKIEELEELEDQIIFEKVEVEGHGTFVNIEQQKEQVMEFDELQDGYILEKVVTKDEILSENLEEHKEQSIPSFEIQDGQVLESIRFRGEKAFESIERQKKIETDEVTDAHIFENIDIKVEETFKNIEKQKERDIEPDKLHNGQVLENVVSRGKEMYGNIEKQKEIFFQSVELYDGEILENVLINSEETFTNLKQQKEKIIKPEELQVGQILEDAVLADEETFENTEEQSGKVTELEKFQNGKLLEHVEVKGHGTLENNKQPKEQVVEPNVLQDGHIFENVETKDEAMFKNLEEYKEQDILSFELQDGQALEDVQVKSDKAYQNTEKPKEIVIGTDAIKQAQISENAEIKVKETFKNVEQQREKDSEPDEFNNAHVLENVITKDKEMFGNMEQRREKVLQSVELQEGEIFENNGVNSEEMFTKLEQLKEQIMKPEELQDGQILENSVVSEEKTFDNIEEQNGQVTETEELRKESILENVETKDYGTFENIEKPKEQVMELDELQDGYILENVETKDDVTFEHLEDHKEQAMQSVELQDAQVKGKTVFKNMEQPKESATETDELKDAQILENIQTTVEETFENIEQKNENEIEPYEAQDEQALENVITKDTKIFRNMEEGKDRVLQSVKLQEGKILENVEVKSEETFRNLEQQKEQVMKPDDLQDIHILENARVKAGEIFRNLEQQTEHVIELYEIQHMKIFGNIEFKSENVFNNMEQPKEKLNEPDKIEDVKILEKVEIKEKETFENTEQEKEHAMESTEFQGGEFLENATVMIGEIFENIEQSNEQVVQLDELQLRQVLESVEVNGEKVFESTEQPKNRSILLDELEDRQILETTEVKEKETYENMEEQIKKIKEPEELQDGNILEKIEVECSETFENIENQEEKIMKPEVFQDKEIFDKVAIKNEGTFENIDQQKDNVMESDKLQDGQMLENVEIKGEKIFENMEQSSEHLVESDELENVETKSNKMFENIEEQKRNILESAELEDGKILKYFDVKDEEMFTNIEQQEEQVIKPDQLHYGSILENIEIQDEKVFETIEQLKQNVDEPDGLQNGLILENVEISDEKMFGNVEQMKHHVVDSGKLQDGQILGNIQLKGEKGFKNIEQPKEDGRTLEHVEVEDEEIFRNVQQYEQPILKPFELQDEQVLEIAEPQNEDILRIRLEYEEISDDIHSKTINAFESTKGQVCDTSQDTKLKTEEISNNADIKSKNEVEACQESDISQNPKLKDECLYNADPKSIEALEIPEDEKIDALQNIELQNEQISNYAVLETEKAVEVIASHEFDNFHGVVLQGEETSDNRELKTDEKNGFNADQGRNIMPNKALQDDEITDNLVLRTDKAIDSITLQERCSLTDTRLKGVQILKDEAIKAEEIFGTMAQTCDYALQDTELPSEEVSNTSEIKSGNAVELASDEETSISNDIEPLEIMISDNESLKVNEKAKTVTEDFSNGEKLKAENGMKTLSNAECQIFLASEQLGKKYLDNDDIKSSGKVQNITHQEGDHDNSQNVNLHRDEELDKRELQISQVSETLTDQEHGSLNKIKEISNNAGKETDKAIETIAIVRNELQDEELPETVELKIKEDVKAPEEQECQTSMNIEPRDEEISKSEESWTDEKVEAIICEDDVLKNIEFQGEEMLDNTKLQTDEAPETVMDQNIDISREIRMHEQKDLGNREAGDTIKGRENDVSIDVNPESGDKLEDNNSKEVDDKEKGSQQDHDRNEQEEIIYRILAELGKEQPVRSEIFSDRDFMAKSGTDNKLLQEAVALNNGEIKRGSKKGTVNSPDPERNEKSLTAKRSLVEEITYLSGENFSVKRKSYQPTADGGIRTEGNASKELNVEVYYHELALGPEVQKNRNTYLDQTVETHTSSYECQRRRAHEGYEGDQTVDLHISTDKREREGRTVELHAYEKQGLCRQSKKMKNRQTDTELTSYEQFEKLKQSKGNAEFSKNKSDNMSKSKPKANKGDIVERIAEDEARHDSTSDSMSNVKMLAEQQNIKSKKRKEIMRLTETVEDWLLVNFSQTEVVQFVSHFKNGPLGLLGKSMDIDEEVCCQDCCRIC